MELDRRTSTNADVESVREAIASLLDDVERDRATVETRLDTMARDRSEQAAEIGHASRAVANQLEGLVERIERVEHLQVAGATETTRLSAEWAARIEAVTSLEAQLQSLAESVAEAARGAENEDGAGLTELDARLQAVERAGVDVAAEITRVSASWSTELERIAAKIDDSAATALDATSRDAQTERILTELGTRLDAIVHERQTVAAQIAMASENEVAELRTLIAGFRTRLAPVDLESPGPPYVGGRLDELAAGSTRSATLARIRNSSPARVRVAYGSSCALSSFARSAPKRRLNRIGMRFSRSSICSRARSSHVSRGSRQSRPTPRAPRKPAKPRSCHFAVQRCEDRLMRS